MARSNKMTADFTDKPRTQELADLVEQKLGKIGDTRRDVKAQLSFGVKRKFLWMWAYEATPDGTLYLTVTLDQALENKNFHYVKQVSPNRWNHHVVLRSERQVTGRWFEKLLQLGYAFAS